jgi:hypothetical protein
MQVNESKQKGRCKTRAYKDVRSQIGISVVVDCIRHFLDTELEGNGISGIDIGLQEGTHVGKSQIHVDRSEKRDRSMVTRIISHLM